jgi:CRP/FNR family transcriptional regulator
VPWSTLLDGLSAAEQTEVARCCTEKTFRKRQIIFSVGDAPDALYLLREGWVKLRLLSQEGQESIVQMFRPGDVFGEILLAVRERAFEAVALDEVRVAVLSRSQLLGLLQSVPLFGMNFIRLLSARLAEVRQDLAAFGHAAASHRLARTLLRLADQQGEGTSGGHIRLARPVTHETLANLIGTSRETVSAQMRRFARAGLLAYHGRTLLLRIDRLRALVGSPSRARRSRRP